MTTPPDTRTRARATVARTHRPVVPPLPCRRRRWPAHPWRAALIGLAVELVIVGLALGLFALLCVVWGMGLWTL